MAIENCTCLGSGGNTGTPSCVTLFGDGSGFAFTELVAKDGTKKEYDILDAASFGTAFKDDFVNSDFSMRLLPVSGLQNVDFPQEEVQYITANNGQKEFLRNGILSFSGEAWNKNSVFASKINASRCKNNGVFVATDKGVWGKRVADYTNNTYSWQPVPITALYAQWMPKKPGQDIEKVMVSFDFSLRLEVGELWLMTWEELGLTEDDFALEGLQDVNFVETQAAAAALGTTTTEQRLITDYGDNYSDEQNVDGLVAADFVVTNLTSGLPVANLTVTETVDDYYGFSYDTETTGDTIEIKMNTSTTIKFEGSTSYAEPA
jgi:hypothetical protein